LEHIFKEHVPHMMESTTRSFTFLVISATTMVDEEEEKPVIYGGSLFLRPRQFALFEGTHQFEIKRWFDSKKILDVRQKERVYRDLALGSYHVLLTLKKVTKESHRLTFEIKIGICYDKWFGCFVCRAAICNLPTPDQILPEHFCTPVASVSCRYCKDKNFCCAKHDLLAAKTTCSCQEKK
jgi:hypothetical protein